MPKESQKSKLFKLLQDNLLHSTIEICEKVYGGSHLGLSRVGARVYDLRQEGKIINGWKDKKNLTVYWYQLEPDYCCYSFKVFGTHTADCPIYNEMERTAKIIENQETRLTLWQEKSQERG